MVINTQEIKNGIVCLWNNLWNTINNKNININVNLDMNKDDLPPVKTEGGQTMSVTFTYVWLYKAAYVLLSVVVMKALFAITGNGVVVAGLTMFFSVLIPVLLVLVLLLLNLSSVIRNLTSKKAWMVISIMLLGIFVGSHITTMIAFGYILQQAVIYIMCKAMSVKFQ